LPASRLAAALRARPGATALIPYLTAGYPSLEGSLEIMRALERAGAMALEVGVPFSDPIADGPDIQRASEWALRQGVGAPEALDLVASFRATSSLPVVLMSYVNPVSRLGAAAFAQRAKASGVDAVLLSDLPPEELPELWAALDAAALDTVLLVAPTTSARRLPALLRRCRGFVYCLARTGVTGGHAGESGSLDERLAAVRAATDLPVAVGFGIASTADARALRGKVDAAIVGAAFMRLVREDPARGAPDRVGALAAELVAALS
jgi:tryptophan synthase alpha chain